MVRVFAIAVAGGKVYAGGVFTNAGDQRRRQPRRLGRHELGAVLHRARAETIGNVRPCRSSDRRLYVGGDFQDGAGIATADYLLACDLATGAPSATTVDPTHPFSGPVRALTATSDGTLYAGGGSPTSRTTRPPTMSPTCPRRDWQPMGPAAAPVAVRWTLRPRADRRRDRRVRRHRGDNVAGIAEADHVVKWDGSEWSAVGSNTARRERVVPGDDQHLRPGQRRLATSSSRDVPERERRRARRQHRLVRRHRLAPGRVQRRRQRPVVGEGSALALVDRQLYAAGTSRAPAATPGAVRRLVRALADHRLPDADGDRRARAPCRRPR